MARTVASDVLEGPKSSDRVKVVARSRTLGGFARNRGVEDGVALESLEPGTKVTVQTRHSLYQLTVIDGPNRTVLVTGGEYFADPTPATLNGASAGGSLLKAGWIGVGLRMELAVDRRHIISSPVRSIVVEVAPPAFADVDSRT